MMLCHLGRLFEKGFCGHGKKLNRVGGAVLIHQRRPASTHIIL
jgi:hypothetical protein